MRLREVIKRLDELAPPAYACDWDNPGLLVGRMDKEVRRALVSLDATDEVIGQAEAFGADLIVTHHPLIFKAVKKINDENFITRRVIRLIRADIGCFSMHTNFDAAPGCMADLAAERLGMISEAPLEPVGEEKGISFGIGKVGVLPERMPLSALAQRVKAAFGLPFVTVYGWEQAAPEISRIAVSPGSGRGMLDAAAAAGAQAVITGDIGHHEGIDAAAEGLAVIDAGHYGLEHIFIPFLAAYLKEISGGEIEAAEALPAFPARVLT